jgi:hypothetical protein
LSAVAPGEVDDIACGMPADGCARAASMRASISFASAAGRRHIHGRCESGNVDHITCKFLFSQPNLNKANRKLPLTHTPDSRSPLPSPDTIEADKG